MLTLIEGCAEYEYQNVPYKSLLGDMGINATGVACEIQLPICTQLSLGDEFNERLQYLAETFGAAYEQAESSLSRSRQLFDSGTRKCDHEQSKFRLKIPIKWSQLLKMLYNQLDPLSLRKTKFS